MDTSEPSNMATIEAQMSAKRYPEEFKIEAVRQIVDRGYSVAGVASRLGVRNTACMPGYAVTDPIRTRQQRRMKRRKRFAVFRPS